MSLRGGTEIVDQLARGYASNLARESSRFLVVRPSLGVKVKVGVWLFNKGEVLNGILITHPVNAARKVVIRTEWGTFNLNEEDVKKL